MSPKVTALLAGVLALALVYIKFVLLPGEEAEKQKQLLLASTPKSAISEIEITKGETRYTLLNTAPKAAEEKAEGEEQDELEDDDLKSWTLAELKGADLDAAALNSLLSELANTKLEAFEQEGVEQDLAIYGLNPPELRLKVSANGKVTELLIGKENEVTEKRYAKLADKPTLFAIRPDLHLAANREREEFRDKTPVPLAQGEVASFTLTDKESKRVLSRKEARWSLSEPVQAQADTATVNEILRGLESLQVDQFIDSLSGAHPEGAPTREALTSSPELAIEVSYKEDAKRAPLSVKLLRGATVSEAGERPTYFLVNDEPSIFKANSDALKGLNKPVDALRERKLFTFVTGLVQSVEYRKPSPLTVSKDGTEWKVNGKKGDAPFIEKLLEDLSGLTAAGFPHQNADFGFSEPRVEVVVNLEDGTKRTLKVGAQLPLLETPMYFAGVDELKEPFVINDETLKAITPAEEKLLFVEPSPSPTAEAAASEAPTPAEQK